MRMRTREDRRSPKLPSVMGPRRQAQDSRMGGHKARTWQKMFRRQRQGGATVMPGAALAFGPEPEIARFAEATSRRIRAVPGGLCEGTGHDGCMEGAVSRVLPGGRPLRSGADVPVALMIVAHGRSRAGMSRRQATTCSGNAFMTVLHAQLCTRSRAQDGRHTGAPDFPRPRDDPTPVLKPGDTRSRSSRTLGQPAAHHQARNRIASVPRTHGEKRRFGVRCRQNWSVRRDAGVSRFGRSNVGLPTRMNSSWWSAVK